MKKLFMILSLVLVLCFTFSCSSTPLTYLNVFEGPPRPIDEVAYLRRYSLLEFCEIDGLLLKEIRTMNEFTGAFQGYAILPGEHTVKIRGIPSEWTPDVYKRVDILASIFFDEGFRFTMMRWEQGKMSGNPRAIYGEWTLKFSADAGQTYFLGKDYKELFSTNVMPPNAVNRQYITAYSVSPYIINEKIKQKVSSIVEFKQKYKSTRYYKRNNSF